MAETVPRLVAVVFFLALLFLKARTGFLDSHSFGSA